MAAVSTPSSSSRPSNLRLQSRQHPSSPSGEQTPSRAPALPPYEPQVAALNPNAKRLLNSISNSNATKNLREHLEKAASALTENAGGVHDRLADARIRVEKQRKKSKDKEAAGEDEQDGESEGDGEGDEAQRKLEELEKNVAEATEKLEEKMRDIVDSEERVDNLMGLLGEMSREEAPRGPPGPAPARRTRGRGQDVAEDGDEEDPNPEPQEGNTNDTPVTPASEVLDRKLTDKKDRWESLSLTERYTTNNNYIGFKRVMHESKYPRGEVPPLPPASTWFSHLEDIQAGAGPSQRPSLGSRNKRKHAGLQEAEVHDDEMIVRGERVSLKCPITLLRFKDPVTSTKCPHSFEREAIEGMIRSGVANRGGRRRNMGRRGSVQCPLCSEMLTLDDLRTDPVLQRRVRRANEMEAVEYEEGSEEEDGNSDEDVMLREERRRKRKSVNIKREKTRTPSEERSMVPDTQFDVVNDEVEEAEEEEEEDEEDGEDEEGSAGSGMDEDEEEEGYVYSD